MSLEIDAKEHEKLIDDHTNVGKESLLKKGAQMLTGLLVLLFCFVLVYVTISDFVIVNLPESAVHRIHKVAKNIPLDHVQNPPENLYNYLNKLLNQLVSASDLNNREFELLIIKAPEVNAFAYPGNRIVLTSGLLATVESPNELAMVLGHELGHFSSRDNLRAFSKQALAILLFTFILPQDMVADTLSHGFQSSVLQFSRRQETVADSYALNLVHDLYRENSSGVTDFFARDELKTLNFPIAKYFSTHPVSEDRVQALTKAMHQLKMKEKGKSSFPKWWKKSVFELNGIPYLDFDDVSDQSESIGDRN